LFHLLEGDPNSNSKGQENVYAKGVEYENALGAASARGQETIVRLLLDHGADVNGEWGDYGPHFTQPRRKVTKISCSWLLDSGADVNAQWGYDEMTALYAASSGRPREGRATSAEERRRRS
jgi:hypothetical protein